MYRTILVPLDGSPFSERAVPLAASLARVGASRIVLVRAVSASAPSGGDQVAAEQHAVAGATAYLSKVAQDLAGQNLTAAIATPVAPARHGILQALTDHGADLIVMCTHGRSGLGRWIYGSVAEAVLASSPVPVVLARPTGPLYGLTLAPGPKPILAPLDGSPLAEAALEHALQLAGVLQTTIALLRVVTPQLSFQPDLALGQSYASSVSERVLHEEQQAAEDYLKQAAARVTAAGVAVQWAVRIGWPAEAILDEARRTGAELAVMATHGRTGLADVLLGNVALDVVRRGSIPLMLVRPPVMVRSDA